MHPLLKPNFSREDTQEFLSFKQKKDGKKEKKERKGEKKERKEKKERRDKKEPRSPRMEDMTFPLPPRYETEEESAEDDEPPLYTLHRAGEGKPPEYFLASLRGDPLPETLRELEGTIKGEDQSWVDNFIDLGGINCLVDVLSLKNRKANRTELDSTVEVEAIRCIDKLLNFEVLFNLLS